MSLVRQPQISRLFTSVLVESAAVAQEQIDFSSRSNRPRHSWLSVFSLAIAGALSSLAICPIKAAQPPGGQSGSAVSPKPEIITLETSFVDCGGGGAMSPIQADVKLGELQTSRDYEIRLAVGNDTGQDIVFHRVDGSCGCAKLELGGNVFPASKNSMLVLRIRTPPSQQLNELVIYFRILDSNGKDVAGIRILGRLAGNLSLKAISNVMVVPEKGVATMAVPVVHSAPIRTEDLQITLSESLGDMVAELVHSKIDETIALELTVAGGVVQDGTSGTVRVTDRVSGKTVSMDLMLTRAMPVTISPVMIRFREDPKVADRWTANVLIRVDMPPVEEGGPLPGLERVTVRLGGQPVDLEFTELKNRIYSGRLNIPTNFLGRDNDRLIWEFAFVDRKPVVIETLVFGDEK